MPIRLALAGDTMLGRGVAERLREGMAPGSLFAPEVVAIARDADRGDPGRRPVGGLGTFVRVARQL